VVRDDVAHVVERGGEAHVADHVGRAVGELALEELRGGEGGGVDRLGRDLEADPLQARRKVARGVERVVGKHQKLALGGAQALDKLVCARHRL
jgi:hypothetical protein